MGLAPSMTTALGFSSRAIVARALDLFERGRLDLVDHDHVGPPQIDLAGIVVQPVLGAVRIHHRDPQVRLVERHVVVAAVPDHYVGLGFGLAQNAFVVHAGIDDAARHDVRLVLLALLDRHLVAFHILHRGKTLHGLRHEVAIGHGVAHRHDAQPHVAQRAHHGPAGLALAGARARGADGHHRLGGRQHRLARAQQHIVGARRHRLRAEVHHVLVRHVAVAKHGQVDVFVGDQVVQLAFGHDRDALRVELACQFRGVPPVLDIGNLGGRKGDHLVIGVVAEKDIKVVKIAAGCSEDDSRAAPLQTSCPLQNQTDLQCESRAPPVYRVAAIIAQSTVESSRLAT